MRIRSLILSLCLGMLSPAVFAADEGRLAEVALGMRFCELAQQVAAPDVAHMRQCEAFLEAARLSDPGEARYARLLADALLRLNDSDAAIGALEAYRRLQPGDQVAQLEVIGLYVHRLQSADAKFKYLHDLLSRESIPREVRAVIAAQCGQILLEIGKDEYAREMVDRSLALDPLNLPSLEMKAGMLKSAGPGERAAVLVGMLRSNPAQPGAFLSVARIAGSVGLLREAIDWYTRSAYLRPSPEVTLEVACALFLSDQLFSASDQAPGAARVLDHLISEDAENYQAMTLRLLVEKRSEKHDGQLVEKLEAQSRNYLVNRLAAIRRVLGAVNATTRPVTDSAIALPDMGDDVERWRRSENARAKEEYLQSLAGLAFHEVYVANRPDEAEKLLGIYAQLASPADVVLARIAGWILLARDRREEARVKLSAAASAADALAALGLIRSYASSAEDRDKAVERARQLMAANPAGPLGALIYDGVRDLGVKVTASADAAAVKAALDAFPGDFMNILARPQRFYSLRVEPLKVSHALGEPILARISVQNTSEHDLTIGANGVIKPDVWVNVQFQGSRRGVVNGVCIERLSDQLVLKPRQTISRTVRVDQNALLEQLRQNPTTAVLMSIEVRTNVASPEAPDVSGPCGYAAVSAKLVERSGFVPTPAAIERLCASVVSGPSEKRMRGIELLALVNYYVQNDRHSGFNASAPAMVEALRKAQGDPLAAIRAHASYQHLFTLSPADQAAEIDRMLADSAWQVRFLGLAAVTNLPTVHPMTMDRRKAILANAAEKSAEPLLKRFAAASLETLVNRASTQPATQPGVGVK